MAYLYILSEGERDELLYDLLAERVTGRKFDRPEEFRLRHGANLKTALAGGRLLLNRFRHWREPQEVALILAIDNDRAPGHPGASAHPRPLVGHDLKKAARYPAVVNMVEDALGRDRSQWPVDVAIAMPVEMIESWVLHLHDPQRAALPIFAEAAQASAKRYHGNQHSPPQLKDLCKQEAAAKGLRLEEFFWHAGEQPLDPVIAVSPSFRMFVDEIRQWRGATGN
jgi:hypothetical protein